MQSHLTESAIERLADSPAAEPDEAQEDHLTECDRCRREVALARAVSRSLSQVPLAEAPPELFLGVMEALTPTARPRMALWSMGIFAVGALVLVLLWLGVGGVDPWALDAVAALRSVALLGRLVTLVGPKVPVEIVVLCAVVMVAAGVALRELVLRAGPSPRAVEAG